MSARRYGLLLIVLLTAVFSVYAQRPNPGGGNRPTPAGGAPNPQITPPATGGNRPTPAGGGGSGSLPATPNGGVTFPVTPGSSTFPLQVTPITDWSSLTLPTDIPTTVELQAMLTSGELPYDIPTENLQFPASSSTAYSAVVGFGQQYLSVAVAPIYAAEFDTTAARPRQTSTVPAELEAILAQFPAEVQAILASASGIAYAALLSDGAAVVYTDDCSGTNCTMTSGNIQFQITQGSLGAFAVYRQAAVASETDALNLLKATYPLLNSLALTSSAVETGYAFTAFGTDLQSGIVTGYYVGTVSVESYTLVYAAVGVGQGYVDVIQQSR